MDKRKLLVLFWLGAMLVPINLLQTYTGDLRFVILRLLSSELAHVAGHLFLFSMLVVIVLAVFQPPLNRRTALLTAGMVLAVGLGQEFLQLIAKGRGFGGPEVFDLGVDMVAGVVGWQVTRWLRRYSRYLRMAYYMLRQARNSANYG